MCIYSTDEPVHANAIITFQDKKLSYHREKRASNITHIGRHKRHFKC